MEKILKYKKSIIISSLVLLIIIVGIVYYYYYRTDNVVQVVESEVKIEEIEKQAEEIQEEVVEEIAIVKDFFVDIKGAVNNPGVYKLNENNIVNDAINVAGGLNKYADTKCINLSKKLHDEMVIYVYTKSETWQILNNNNNKQTETETNVVCNEVKNDAYVTENKIEEKIETDKTNEKEDANALVNINSDDIDKLTTLPGIGESKAKTIIEYRKTNGNFKTIEELKNVSGIGDSTFEKIKDLITI